MMGRGVLSLKRHLALCCKVAERLRWRPSDLVADV